VADGDELGPADRAVGSEHGGAGVELASSTRVRLPPAGAHVPQRLYLRARADGHHLAGRKCCTTICSGANNVI
jgi:hypothetical protein